MAQFLGGVCGYFGYESARFMDDYEFLGRNDFGIPDIGLLLVDRCVVLDHSLNKLYLVASGSSRLRQMKIISDVLLNLNRIPEVKNGDHRPEIFKEDRLLQGVTSNFSSSEYQRAIEEAREWVRAGDTYQINFIPAMAESISRFSLGMLPKPSFL